MGPVTEIGERGVEIVGALDQADRLGCDRQRAYGFVVAGVPDVQHGEALACPHPRFVVHLGDERADRIHHVTAFGVGFRDNFGSRAVRRQHQRSAGGHVRHVIDEHDALLAEALHDEPVVDDLVVAVHGRFERPDHPRERFDRHLHPGAEAAGSASSTVCTGRRGGAHGNQASCTHLRRNGRGHYP